MKKMLIDLGRTVVDNYGYNYKDSLNKIYQNTDKKISFEDFIEIDNLYHKKTFEKRNKRNLEVKIGDYYKEIIEKAGLSTNLDGQALDEVFFLEITKNEGLMPDIISLFDFLKKNEFIIVGVSNSCISSASLKIGLKKLGVLKCFDEVLSSCDFGIKKPRSEFFVYGIDTINKIEETKYKNALKYKDEIYFLGNDYYCDIIGSSIVGLKPIWINWNNENDYLHLAYINKSSYKELINELKLSLISK